MQRPRVTIQRSHRQQILCDSWRFCPFLFVYRFYFSHHYSPGLSLRSLNSTLLALLARQQAMFYPTPISLSKPTSPSPPSFSSSSFSSSFLFPKSSSSPSPPFSSFRSPSSPSLTEDPIPEDFFFFSAIYSQLPIVNYPNDPLVQSFCSQVYRKKKKKKKIHQSHHPKIYDQNFCREPTQTFPLLVSTNFPAQIGILFL